MTRILLIRHGATDSAGSVLCGRMPGVHLNAEGRVQAQKLGSHLKNYGALGAVVCSPLERAVETAEALSAPQGIPVTIDHRFNEFDFGIWTGRTFAQLREQPMWAEYNQYRSTHGAPEGEALVDVQGRAWKGIRSLCDQFPEATVAVVSHADVIRSILMLALGIPLDNVLRLDIQPASVSELSVGVCEPVLHRIGLL